MRNDNDGGPAFPQPRINNLDGMSLRDWFAGQALSGMISGGWIPTDEADCARRMWAIADAMLAERLK